MKQQRKRFPLRNIVLKITGTAGGVALAMVAPKVLAELRKMDPAYVKKKDIQRNIQETLWRMSRAGLISLPSNSRGRVTLLPGGEKIIEKLMAGNYRIPTSLIWDGKWHIIMFDVPEYRRSIRDQLRRFLRNAGLVRLHDSVWIYPYECNELITLVKAHLKNTKGELHYTGDLMESDRSLREHFKLKL